MRLAAQVRDTSFRGRGVYPRVHFFSTHFMALLYSHGEYMYGELPERLHTTTPTPPPPSLPNLHLG